MPRTATAGRAVPPNPWTVEDDGGFEETTDEVTAREDEDAPPPPTALDAIDGRRPRMVSFEQEVAGEANDLAVAFYDEGLSPFNHVRGYHSSGDAQAWLHVEEDASVDGEVIYSRLRLDRRGVARRVESALGIVQDHIVDGAVALDSRCGFHVHVGLGYDLDAGDGAGAIRTYGMDQVRSLYHVWNYVEDAVYRLGAANWKRHRSDHGNDYAPPMDKSLTDQNRRNMGAVLSRYRGALNFGPFLNSRQHCVCGAQQWAAWDECDCAVPKPTVEFRVFNATANTRKVRAYTALALALVGHAAEHVYTEDDLPVQPWRGSSNMDEDASRATLAWILDELPLTAAELADVRYCAETSMQSGPGSLAAVL